MFKNIITSLLKNNKKLKDNKQEKDLNKEEKTKNQKLLFNAIYEKLLSVANENEKIELNNIDFNNFEQIKALLLSYPDLYEKFIITHYPEFKYIKTMEEFEENFTFIHDIEESAEEELKKNNSLLALSKKDGKVYLFIFLPIFNFKTNINYQKIAFLSPAVFNFYFQNTLSLDDFESQISFEELLNYIENKNINDFHIRGLDENRYVFTGRIGQEVVKFGGVKPVGLVEDLILQAKLMMNKDTTTIKPEDTGFIKINLNTPNGLVERTFRVNIVMSNKIHSQVYSVSIRRLMTIREIEKLGLDGLGYSKKVQELIKKVQYRKQGLSLVVGKTNSGKTTLLALLLNQLYKAKANQEKRIISIENPVEIVQEYDQIDLSVTENADPDKRMDMKRAMKSILRHDPDVVLIGEVRTDEDIKAYINLGLSSGVNAFTTLHAGDAKTAILRLLKASDSPIDVLSSLNGIIVQNLISKICPVCKGKQVLDNGETCPKCKGLGKYGMVPVNEIVYFKKVSPSEFVNDNNEIDYKRFFDFNYMIEKGYIEYISKTETAYNYLKQGLITEEDFKLIKDSEEEIYKVGKGD